LCNENIEKISQLFELYVSNISGTRYAGVFRMRGMTKDQIDYRAFCPICLLTNFLTKVRDGE